MLLAIDSNIDNWEIDYNNLGAHIGKSIYDKINEFSKLNMFHCIFDIGIQNSLIKNLYEHINILLGKNENIGKICILTTNQDHSKKFIGDMPGLTNSSLWDLEMEDIANEYFELKNEDNPDYEEYVESDEETNEINYDNSYISQFYNKNKLDHYFNFKDLITSEFDCDKLEYFVESGNIKIQSFFELAIEIFQLNNAYLNFITEGEKEAQIQEFLNVKQVQGNEQTHKKIADIFLNVMKTGCTVNEAVNGNFTILNNYNINLANILAQFEEYQFEEGKMTYTDLLYYTYLEFKNNRNTIYNHIIIPDFQDLNQAFKRKITLELSKGNQIITIIGNSAHDFNRNLTWIQPKIPGIRTIVMENNLTWINKSNVNLINFLMKYQNNIPYPFAKKLHIAIDAREDKKPSYVEVENSISGAKYIADEIKELISTNQYKKNHIAIITHFRDSVLPVQKCLIKYNIPFRLDQWLDSKYRWIESDHILDVLAYINAIDTNDKEDWIRIIRITKNINKNAERIYNKLKMNGFDINRFIYETNENANNNIPKLSVNGHWSELHSLLRTLNNIKYQTDLSERIEKVMQHYRSLNCIRKLKRRKSASIIEDLQVFKNYARNFESIREMLGFIKSDPGVCSDSQIRDRVTITSLLSAKDLLKRVVFIPDGLVGRRRPEWSNIPEFKIPQYYSKAFSISTELTYFISPERIKNQNAYEHPCLNAAKENNLFHRIYAF